MARLALVAMLLLASLPTLGRLAQGASHDDGASSWGAMCTAAGLQTVAVSLFASGTDPAAGHPDGGGAAHPHGGPDCDYCPLLASLLVAALCLALLPPTILRAPSYAARVAAGRWTFHPCGLGSRGPPLSS